MPVSATRIFMPLRALAEAEMTTEPPSGVNFEAFDNRFSMICLTLRSSARKCGSFFGTLTEIVSRPFSVRRFSTRTLLRMRSLMSISSS